MAGHGSARRPVPGGSGRRVARHLRRFYVYLVCDSVSLINAAKAPLRNPPAQG